MNSSHKGFPKANHLLSGVIHKEGVVIAQEEVDEKTNEIKHVRPFFKNINIEGSVVTADALHTQKDYWVLTFLLDSDIVDKSRE